MKDKNYSEDDVSGIKLRYCVIGIFIGIVIVFGVVIFEEVISSNEHIEIGTLDKLCSEVLQEPAKYVNRFAGDGLEEFACQKKYEIGDCETTIDNVKTCGRIGPGGTVILIPKEVKEPPQIEKPTIYDWEAAD